MTYRPRIRRQNRWKKDWTELLKEAVWLAIVDGRASQRKLRRGLGRVPAGHQGAPGLGRVIDASGHDLAAIAADREADNPAGVAAERENIFTRIDIPELDGPVVAGGGEASTVGKKGDGRDQAGVPLVRGGLFTGPGVPDLDLGGDRSVIGTANRGDRVAVGAKARSCTPVACPLKTAT